MMKAKQSPLQILDFAVTTLDFKLVELARTGEEQGVDLLMNRYEIDIDFDIYVDELIRVAIRAKINQGNNKQPGYSLFAESVCLFKFNDGESLSEDARNALEGFSTVYIALNSLRGLISSFTSNAPFGRYVLPSIDLNDLIEKKKRILEDQSGLTEQVPVQPSKRKTKKVG